MPLTKSGEKITWKEFFHRWKNGIEKTTPLQQINIQLGGTTIMVIGLICGLVVSFFYYKKWWWVVIILIGALLNTIFQYLALWQKKKMLKQVYNNSEKIKGRYVG